MTTEVVKTRLMTGSDADSFACIRRILARSLSHDRLRVRYSALLIRHALHVSAGQLHSIALRLTE